MTGQPPERRLSKFLGMFSFALGVAQLVAPDRLNQLIGVKDTAKTRMIQRAVGVQELTAAQGIFALSPPTPVLWSRVAGDVMHLGLLTRALAVRRNDDRRRVPLRRRDKAGSYDARRLSTAIAAVAGIGIVDTLVSTRYQARWPKEPTQGQPLPAKRDGQRVEAHYNGHPGMTIRASESEIRPVLQRLGIFERGNVLFRQAPGARGTEVIVETHKNTDRLKAELRQAKQLVEVGELVRSDAAPEGGQPKRQIVQRPAQPLEPKALEKVGGGS